MMQDAIGQIAGIMNTFPDIKEIKITRKNIKSPWDSLLEKTNFKT
ncbi:hypothetical protein [Polaribacter litorisediminis]|nr:hypothetical protein [Polaribacter litorisediminis]